MTPRVEWDRLARAGGQDGGRPARVRHRRGAALLLLLVATGLHGCRGDGLVPPAPPDPSRSTLSVSSAALPADGEASATVTATIRDALGMPRAGLTVVFGATAGQLSATERVTDSSGVAVVTIASAVPAFSTLSAAVGGFTVDTPPTVEFYAYADVTGRTTDWRPAPLPGITVAAGSHGVWTFRTVSGTDGTFSFPRVRLPYDLVAVSPDGLSAVQHIGLTRPDPVLSFKRANLTGQLRTATPTVTINCASGDCGWRGSFLGGVTCAPPFLSWPSSSAHQVHWTGPATTRMLVGALFSDAFASPPTRWWYAATEVDLTDGATPSVTLDLQPAPTEALTVVVPAGSARPVSQIMLATRAGACGWGYGLDWYSWDAINTNGAVTVQMPVVPGFSAFLDASAADGSWVSMQGPPYQAGPIPFSPPPPPSLLAPAHGASGVGPGSVISWSRAEGYVTDIWIRCGDVEVELTTGADTLTLPDLTSLGLAWPAGAACTMTLWSEDRAGPDAHAEFPKPVRPLTLGGSTWSTFTLR